MPSGIYKITNKANGKVYIGQSKDLFQRRDQHFTALQNNRHENKMMQKDYNNNPTDFTWEIIEKCTLSQLNEAERRWIEFYHSNQQAKGYNQNRGGGYKVHVVKQDGRPSCLLDELTEPDRKIDEN